MQNEESFLEEELNLMVSILITKETTQHLPVMQNRSLFFTSYRHSLIAYIYAKAITSVKNGYSVLQDLASGYNSIAEWLALPQVPRILLKKEDR
ncbi:MAG: hypothetical protein U5K69_24440 [Balneolaceae bacterium]|nr:hypothetical protein [Balneolaceae bacterium]